MGRNKTNLAWISNTNLRRATMKKRRNCLIKKVSELATLCDVKACAVVYSPDEPQPEVWPSEQEARNILQCLKSMPQREQSTKMMDQEGYLRQRIAKLEEQVMKEQRENNELQMRLLLCRKERSWVNEIGFEDVVVFDGMIRERVEAVHERIKVLKAAMEMKEGGLMVIPTTQEEEEEDDEDGDEKPGRAITSWCGGGGGLEDLFMQSCERAKANELAYGGLMIPTNGDEEQEEGRTALSAFGGGSGGGLEDVFLQPYGIDSGENFVGPSQTPSSFSAWPMDLGSFF